MLKVLEMSARWRGSRLHRAAKGGKVDKVRALLELGRDTNASDSNGKTALHWAVEKGHKEIVEMLVPVTDVKISDDIGWTALHFAARNGNNELIQMLLKADAPVDPVDIHGHTPLLLAASSGDVQAVKTLVTAKANISVEDQDNNTALHVVVLSGVIEVVKYLLSKGASADIPKVNKRGEKPEDLAIKEEYWKILNELEKSRMDLVY